MKKRIILSTFSALALSACIDKGAVQEIRPVITGDTVISQAPLTKDLGPPVFIPKWDASRSGLTRESAQELFVLGRSMSRSNVTYIIEGPGAKTSNVEPMSLSVMRTNQLKYGLELSGVPNDLISVRHGRTWKVMIKL